MLTIENISAKKVHTAPGMYVIEASAHLESDITAFPDADIVLFDDGADKEFIVNGQHYDDQDDIPELYHPFFDMLIDVIHLLDNGPTP